MPAQRLTCIFGEEPQKVAEARRSGKSTPDAADTCVAALVRIARDGHLLDLYRTLLAELKGDTGTVEKLPTAIGNAVLEGDGRVALGNGNFNSRRAAGEGQAFAATLMRAKSMRLK